MENSLSYYRKLLMENIEEKELSPKQKKIAKLDPPTDKIDAGDFKKLRAGAKNEVDTPSTPSTYSGTTPSGLGPIVDMEEGESQTHFYITGLTNDKKNQQIKDIAAKAGLNIKMKIINPEEDVQITLGNNFKMKDAEKMARILDKLDTEWEDTIGLGFSMREANIKEGEDHEVSMANNSLETIIKHAMDLKSKLGNDEKDIPAWIQDHITNAANFISQAAENYHEYGDHEGEELAENISITIPEDTDYKEFAYEVANILKKDYGEHNFQPFIKALSDELSKQDDMMEELSLEEILKNIKNGHK